MRQCRTGIPDREHALLWIEENQLGRRNLPDDQRAALALRVLKRRTALSLSERNKAAGEARAGSALRDENGRLMATSVVADGTTKLDENTDKVAPKRKTTRSRTAVAKQANVAENKVRQIAEIEKHDPAAAERIARGESTIREEKAAINKAKREAIKPSAARADAWCRRRGDIQHGGVPRRHAGQAEPKLANADAALKPAAALAGTTCR